MEPQPKSPVPAQRSAAPSPSPESGRQMAPPGFALSASPMQRKSATDDATLAAYEASNHALPMANLVTKLIGEPRDFTGALHAFVLAGKGLSGNQGRTLAALEAVIGYAFSPIAKTWMEAAIKTNPDQVKEIQALTGKTFEWELEEASLGTEKTTAPIARSGPGMLVQKELFHESWLYAASKEVMAWADKRVDSTTNLAAFSFDALSTDKDLAKAIKVTTDKLLFDQFPVQFEKGVAQPNWRKTQMAAAYASINYNWIVRFMVMQGLITPPGKSSEEYVYNKVLGKAGTEFTRKGDALAKVQGTAEEKAFKLDPKDGLYESEDIDLRMSSDLKQVNEEKDLIKKVKAAEAALAVETDHKKVALLKEELKMAQAALAGKPAYRSFATANMPLWTRLEAKNKTFRLGTYRHHHWGQHSADLFINTSFKEDGFWTESVVHKLIDDLNDAAEMDESSSGGAGKFAWRAIYNDTNVAQVVNKKYGAERMLTGVAGHGPKPDIHIHLDVRPLKLGKDGNTGYTTDPLTGRVVL